MATLPRVPEGLAPLSAHLSRSGRLRRRPVSPLSPGLPGGSHVPPPPPGRPERRSAVTPTPRDPRGGGPRPPPAPEPGSSCPHGRAGANVTPATWHRALALSPSPSPSPSPAEGPPLCGQRPQSRGAAQSSGEQQHRGGPRAGTGTRGSPGGDAAPTVYLGASPAPPAAQMSPRASRSGYRLRLQLPFIAPLPVPCPLSLVPSPSPPGWGHKLRAPQDTTSDQGHWDGADPAVTLGGFVAHRGCPEVAPVAGSPLDAPRVPPMGAPTRPLRQPPALVAGQSRMPGTALEPPPRAMPVLEGTSAVPSLSPGAPVTS
ncbi:basic salivary proline-rich protein 4-like [Ammospiza nelsoni]|uniref:basic salivary proline-rich protein 4-like n=1 Tax=Ammospiza nelsoni TaxID=2857394 RepID=UPI00286A6517|nr:basic salivary proline-rich protein 4-like [Ammospiza nelsoni]